MRHSGAGHGPVSEATLCSVGCVVVQAGSQTALTPAGKWVGVRARMYNDSNSLGDRAKEGRGSERKHAGTGEGISARIHVANSHGERAEEGRRSERRHSANSLWERDDSCMSVGASIVVAYVGRWSEGFNQGWNSI